MKKYEIINDEMMIGLADNGKWRGLARNWAGHHVFRDMNCKWMLFDSVERAEQYLVRLGYCKSAYDRAMEDYCFREVEF